MPFSTIYIILLYLNAILGIAFTVIGWHNRDVPAARTYTAWMFVAGVLWSAAAAVSASVRNPEVARFFGETIRWSAVAIFPHLFFIFVLDFTGHRDRLTPRFVAALWVLPLILLAVVWTNPYHHLLNYNIHYALVGTAMLRTTWTRGPLGWLATFYGYAAALLSLTILLLHAITVPFPYRQQTTLIFVGGLVGVVSYLPSTMGLLPSGYSLLPLGFLGTGLCNAWALFGFHLFDISSVARDLVYLAMDDAAIVLDSASRVTDINPAATRAFDWQRDQVVGKPIVDLLGEEQRPLIEQFGDVKEAQAETTILGRRYDLRISPLNNHRQRYIGRLVVLRDVTQRAQLLTNLRESEERFRHLAENSRDIIWIWAPGNQIEYVSPAYEYFTGRPTEWLVRKPALILKMIHPDDRGKFSETLAAIEGGEYRKAEMRVMHRDGTIYHLEGWGVPIRDGEGQIVRFIGIWRDVSERVQLVEALNAYAHTVAHDLKNPLGIIIGYSSWMEDQLADTLSEDASLSLRTIQNTSYKMVGIIDELLVLASVRDLREISVGELNMERIVEDALDRLMQIVAEAQAETVLPDDWPTAVGYAPWVEEIWANYISNALKYGGTPPRLEFGSTVEPGGKTVRFWLQDNGKGLSEEEQAKLFEQFSRLEPARATGHGLGLSIVRRIATRMGGKVGVESEMGRGSRFFFTLPTHEEE